MTPRDGREEAPFSVAIRNVELMHECFLKHLRMNEINQKKVMKKVKKKE